MKLNGGRNIVGILRGFDPFMNLVIDDTVEETKDGSKNSIGMVVRLLGFNRVIFHLFNKNKCLRWFEAIPLLCWRPWKE